MGQSAWPTGMNDYTVQAESRGVNVAERRIVTNSTFLCAYLFFCSYRFSDMVA